MIHKQQGFSLIELVVVMIMIAGLVAIVAPGATKSLQSSKKFIEEKKIHSIVKQVSKLAFYSGQPVVLSFENNDVNIWLGEELYKKEVFEELNFNSAKLHFSATGFLTPSPVKFKIENTLKVNQLLIDCEENYVICKV
ncbi:hypothetical protein A9Q74_10515 [Colwellia sp. 39_35_sub15_T18]|nr:hypothetical protein A9Q74_10515 [Colwellia sp. 39_35_sub15_T18]